MLFILISQSKVSHSSRSKLRLSFPPDFNADHFYFSHVQESYLTRREIEKRTIERVLRLHIFKLHVYLGVDAVKLVSR